MTLSVIRKFSLKCIHNYILTINYEKYIFGFVPISITIPIPVTVPVPIWSSGSASSSCSYSCSLPLWLPFLFFIVFRFLFLILRLPLHACVSIPIPVHISVPVHVHGLVHSWIEFLFLILLYVRSMRPFRDFSFNFNVLQTYLPYMAMLSVKAFIRHRF